MNKKYILVILINVLLLACSDSSKQLTLLTSDATILAFGDSLTYGTGAKPGKDYPALLSKLISLEVINAGIPGEISSKGLQRLPALIEQHSPDLIILIHGGNDILKKLPRSEQKNNLLAMIEQAQIKNIPIIMLGVPEPGIFLKSAEIYQEIADETSIPVEFELLPDVLGDKSLKSDIAHPNAKGYKILAEGIFEFLKNNGAL